MLEPTATAIMDAALKIGEQFECTNQTVDNTPVLSDVSEHLVSVGSNSATCCSLPQCDTCLALLQSHQIPLAPISVYANSTTRSQLDNTSHTNSHSVNKTIFSQPSESHPAQTADTERKISVMSNQSTMSTDSDYVSDTNNLYFDGHVRKLSDIQNYYEAPNREILTYPKATSCNLSLNLSAIRTSKSSVKDQSCQTPIYTPDSVDFRNEVKLSDIQRMQIPFTDGVGVEDARRKISNISTISTLSSLSTESTSTFDTVTLGPDNSTSNEELTPTQHKFEESFVPSLSQVSWSLSERNRIRTSHCFTIFKSNILLYIRSPPHILHVIFLSVSLN